MAMPSISPRAVVAAAAPTAALTEAIVAVIIWPSFDKLANAMMGKTIPYRLVFPFGYCLKNCPSPVSFLFKRARNASS